MEEKEILKLITLINEHDGVETIPECFERDRDLLPTNVDSISFLKDFIKWLLEQDKINLESGPLYGTQLIMHNRQPYTLCETILMLLAIEENPVEFLCSILK